MNRSLKAGEILDYDPQIESYLTKHSEGHVAGGRATGKLVIAIMLASGIIVAWLYGMLGKMLQVSYWRNSLGLLGYNIPYWILGAFVFLMLIVGLVPRRGHDHSTIRASIDY